MARPWLWRDGPDGRAVSWRVWVLVWVLPVCFLGGALVSWLIVAWDLDRSVVVTGEVVQVYAWPGEWIFERGVTNYAPVFVYDDPVKGAIRASTGMSHPDLNLAVGSTHQIHVFPGEDRDVMLPGPHNWLHVWVVGAMGLVLVLPSLWGTWRLRRWLRGPLQ
ncbi:MAG: hypothetical protein QNJ09_02890 [Paracoccaceae bacterium]|nr:hypothetical protein [Paracoccaceae bacterium]